MLWRQDLRGVRTSVANSQPARNVSRSWKCFNFILQVYVASHNYGYQRSVAFTSKKFQQIMKKDIVRVTKNGHSYYWILLFFTIVMVKNLFRPIFHPRRKLPTTSTMRIFHYARFHSGFAYNIEYSKSSDNVNVLCLSHLMLMSSVILIVIYIISGSLIFIFSSLGLI